MLSREIIPIPVEQLGKRSCLPRTIQLDRPRTLGQAPRPFLQLHLKPETVTWDQMISITDPWADPANGELTANTAEARKD